MVHFYVLYTRRPRKDGGGGNRKPHPPLPSLWLPNMRLRGYRSQCVSTRSYSLPTKLIFFPSAHPRCWREATTRTTNLQKSPLCLLFLCPQVEHSTRVCQYSTAIVCFFLPSAPPLFVTHYYWNNNNNNSTPRNSTWSCVIVCVLISGLFILQIWPRWVCQDTVFSNEKKEPISSNSV